MKEQILIDAKKALESWQKLYDKYANDDPSEDTLDDYTKGVVKRIEEALSYSAAGKGESYPISKRACYSCGEYFNPDTEFGVSVFDKDRKYFYCEKCSGKNEHTKPRI